MLVAVAIGTTDCATSGRSFVIPSGGEWPTYGGTYANARYSPLDQITPDNVSRLRIAWRWTSPDHALMDRDPPLETYLNEGTPIMVEGVLYVSTSLSQIAAIDAATGRTLWLHDPQVYAAGTPANFGWVHRGVAYWSDGQDRRILLGTGNGWLIALDARTGKPVASFGGDGRVDLTEGLGRPVLRSLYSVTSPPVIVRDTVIVGSSIHDGTWRRGMPPGDVRGFDVRTGRQRWIFHAVPQHGEVGHETWQDDAGQYTGNTNVWTIMSADEALGYVYLPFSTPSNDYYGGERPGDNVFAESLVCLDATTGKRVWHFQMVHHGLWDYDLPAAPNLVDVTVRGRRVNAVVQVTKQGFAYAFDRHTGQPLWPIDERPVPQSTVEGEKSARTQPFPTRPAPFERQGIRLSDLIDFTPELAEEARAILERYDHGPLFTPPTERGVVAVPGPVGGALWSGAAVDPETGRLYVTSVTRPFVIQVQDGLPLSGMRSVGRIRPLDGPRGLPLVRPPYGRITAIDMNTGEHAWMAPLGDGPRRHPLLRHLDLPPLGSPRIGFPLVTKTLLVVGQGPPVIGIRLARDRRDVAIRTFAIEDPTLRAFDKATGRRIGEITLPANASGALMTYMVGGKQYIVVPVGGSNIPAELVALSLP
jgi:quinoprotein glucose dehydrogenase